MKLYCALYSALLLMVTSCVTSKPKSEPIPVIAQSLNGSVTNKSVVEIPKAGLKNPSAETPTAESAENVQATFDANEANEVDKNCIVVDGYSPQKPSFVEDSGFVITKFMKPCVTLDGIHGFAVDSAWMAMGFPCTEAGNLEVKGYAYSPKMVSFPLSTNCSMNPRGMPEVAAAGIEYAKLTTKNRLLAYTPFELQYWELQDYSDADTGSVIELRTNEVKDAGWKGFQTGDPLKVTLYGRENTWGSSRNLFRVQAELEFLGGRQFKLNLLSVALLGSEEVSEVSQRCVNLRPRRNCSEVFY